MANSRLDSASIKNLGINENAKQEKRGKSINRQPSETLHKEIEQKAKSSEKSMVRELRELKKDMSRTVQQRDLGPLHQAPEEPH